MKKITKREAALKPDAQDLIQRELNFANEYLKKVDLDNLRKVTGRNHGKIDNR